MASKIKLTCIEVAEYNPRPARVSSTEKLEENKIRVRFRQVVDEDTTIRVPAALLNLELALADKDLYKVNSTYELTFTELPAPAKA